MMYRYLALIFLLLPVLGLAQADTVYYKEDTITTREKATSFMPPPILEDGKYRIRKYYMGGQLKMEGYSISKDSMIYDGYFIFYYENGKKSSYGNYLKGNRVGQWKTKYEDVDKIWLVTNYYVGNADTTQNLNSYYRTGKIKRKQWTVKGRDTGLCYTETGEERPFTQFMQMPEPDYNWELFVSKNLRYPMDALESNQQGKVLVDFIVHKDGAIETIAARSPYLPLAQEAVRVVKSMPKWKPGMYDDEPVKVYFTLPVNFTIR